jgi:hypothetical protein
MVNGKKKSSVSQSSHFSFCRHIHKKSLIYLISPFLSFSYGWSISNERDTGNNDLLLRSFEMAAKEFPWVNKYKNRSVTEIEMRMVSFPLVVCPTIHC